MDDLSIIDQLSVALTKQLPDVQSVLSVQLFASGWRHSLYLAEVQTKRGEVQYLIIRVPSIDKPSRRTTMQREHTVLQLLADVGFSNAPRSYLYDETLQFLPVPYAVQSYHGPPPRSELDSLTSSIKGTRNAGIDVVQIEDVGRVCAHLHTVDFSALYDHGFTYYGTWHEGMLAEMIYLRDWIQNHFQPSSSPPRFLEVEPVVVAAWEAVEHRVESSRTATDETRARPVLTHGDLGWHNFGWVDSKLYLFDWEFAAPGDPALDLARLMRGDLHSADQRHRLLLAYAHADVDPFSQDLRERLTLYEQMMALHTTMWALRMLSKRIGGAGKTGEETQRVNVADFVDLNVYQSLEFIDATLGQRAEEVMAPQIPKGARGPNRTHV